MNIVRLTVLLGVTACGFGQEAVVRKSTIWVDTVKRGDMTRSVRGLGELVRNSIAEVSIPATQAQEIRPGQLTQLDTRNGVVNGKVIRVFPASADGKAKVEVQTEGALPPGAVDAIVQLEVLKNVIYVGQPVVGSPQAQGMLFKLAGDGQPATKINVRYGRSSVNTIEVLSGLQPGDQVILSDMSAFAAKDRIRLE